MRVPKSLFLAVGLLVAGSVAASARPATVTTDLNVRSGPGTRYAVIGSLPAGARVDVGGCTGNWCRVAGGYASASFLSFGGGTSVVVQPGYYGNDVALGVGAFALGAAVGSGWGYWNGPGYWGPGYWGPGYWRGPGWGPRYWGRPGWRGRPVYWRGGPGWRGGPVAPGWRGRPVYRGRPALGGRPVLYRPPMGGGFRGGGFRGGRFR